MDAVQSTRVRSDTARIKVAAMGIPATSAMVAMQAIQEASSAETEKPPPMSAMARSTSCDEMLEPTIAIVMTPMVSIASGSGGRPAEVGGDEMAVTDQTCDDDLRCRL